MTRAEVEAKRATPGFDQNVVGNRILRDLWEKREDADDDYFDSGQALDDIHEALDAASALYATNPHETDEP